jgi:phosphoribosylanthranilate isomerase
VEKIKDQFDYLQLYETSPAKSKALKLISNKKIIQAIKVKKKEDIDLYKQYIGIVDEFLFDSSAMEKSSGFDWSYLKNIKINEWFLAGGININNLEKASKISKKIDISSSLEDNPGVKSSKKISDFLLKVKSL